MRRLVIATVVAAAMAAPAAHAASLPGVNDSSCRPPANHPYPVVIVHGTFGNQQTFWGPAAQALQRPHYCVFALDYGKSPLPGINGVGDIPASAGELGAFIDQVLAATGAPKVSIVGHSQGGMMPRYYMKFLGGLHKVDDLVGFSPSNHGTTNPLAGPAGLLGCPACAQQVAGSPFMQKLNAGDQTPAPVSYTVIETKYDEVVTPYESEFLPETPEGRVTNVLLQDLCPNDITEHVAFPQDEVAIQLMLNAFGRPGPADPSYRPDCSGAALDSYPDSDSTGGSAAVEGRRAASGGAQLRIARARLHGRHLRVVLRARGGRVHGVVVKVRRAGHLLGRSKRLRVAHRRRVTVHLRRAPRHGRVRVTARGRTAGGRRVVARRAVAPR